VSHYYCIIAVNNPKRDHNHANVGKTSFPGYRASVDNKLMKLLLSIFFAISAVSVFPQIELPSPGPLKAPTVSKNIDIWRAAYYSNVRYKLDLTLEKMSPVLKGTIEICVKVTQPRSEPPTILFEPANSKPRKIPPIILDWRKIARYEKDSTIANVTINGQEARSYIDHLLNMNSEPVPITFWEQYQHIIFSDGVVLGENVIKLNFTSPILTSDSAIRRYIDKKERSEYIYSVLSPSNASTAFPVFDQPDLKARFKLDLHLQTNRWKAVSNEKWDGMVTTGGCISLPDRYGKANYPPDCGYDIGFEETEAISIYDFAFVAGPFADKSNIPDVIRRSVPSLVW